MIDHYALSLAALEASDRLSNPSHPDCDQEAARDQLARAQLHATLALAQAGSKNAIKAVRNAKGDPQFEIKVIDGATEAELAALRAIAVREYQALGRELATVAA